MHACIHRYEAHFTEYTKTEKHIPRTLIQETSKPTGTVIDAIFSLIYSESNINEVECHTIHNHVLRILKIKS